MKTYQDMYNEIDAQIMEAKKFHIAYMELFKDKYDEAVPITERMLHIAEYLRNNIGDGDGRLQLDERFKFTMVSMNMKNSVVEFTANNTNVLVNLTPEGLSASLTVDLEDGHHIQTFGDTSIDSGLIDLINRINSIVTY